MYEMRLDFAREMKEAGFNIEIVPNPVYYDEPKKEDINEGTFEAQEDELEDPEGEAPEEEEKEEDNDNGGNED